MPSFVILLPILLSSFLLFPSFAAHSYSAFCWGSNNTGQRDVPPGHTFTSIASGAYHTCGIMANSSAICWGCSDGDQGQCNEPSVITFTSISAGKYHTCGIMTNSSVICWGDNSYGQCNVTSGYTFTSISAGAYHTCGITTDSSTVCWGRNNTGQCDVPSGYTFTSISAGGEHTCGITTTSSEDPTRGITADTLTVCWGCSNEDQDKRGVNSDQCEVPSGYTFTSTSAGQYHTCGITTNSSVVCWSVHNGDQLYVPSGYTFTSISAGWYHTCGITANSSAICWGCIDGDQGQCDELSPSYTFTSVSTGGNHACGLVPECIFEADTVSVSASQLGQEITMKAKRNGVIEENAAIIISLTQINQLNQSLQLTDSIDIEPNKFTLEVQSTNLFSYTNHLSANKLKLEYTVIEEDSNVTFANTSLFLRKDSVKLKVFISDWTFLPSSHYLQVILKTSPMINEWDDSSVSSSNDKTGTVSLIHQLFSSNVIVCLSYLIDNNTADDLIQLNYSSDSNQMSFMFPSFNGTLIFDPDFSVTVSSHSSSSDSDSEDLTWIAAAVVVPVVVIFVCCVVIVILITSTLVVSYRRKKLMNRAEALNDNL